MEVAALSQSLREKELTRVIVAALHANTQLSPQAIAGVGHNRGPPLEGEPAMYTIEAFCAAHMISRSGLYALWRQGIGPRTVKLGRAVKVTRESAAQWRAERQLASDSEAA